MSWCDLTGHRSRSGWEWHGRYCVHCPGCWSVQSYPRRSGATGPTMGQSGGARHHVQLWCGRHRQEWLWKHGTHQNCGKLNNENLDSKLSGLKPTFWEICAILLIYILLSYLAVFLWHGSKSYVFDILAENTNTACLSLSDIRVNLPWNYAFWSSESLRKA